MKLITFEKIASFKFFSCVCTLFSLFLFALFSPSLHPLTVHYPFINIISLFPHAFSFFYLFFSVISIVLNFFSYFVTLSFKVFIVNFNLKLFLRKKKIKTVLI